MSSFSVLAGSLCERDRLALGEWAWNRFRVIAFLTNSNFWEKVVAQKFFPETANNECYIFLEIAVVCLGEETVRKRLEELK